MHSWSNNMDMVNEIFKLTAELDASISRLKDNGCKLAEKERDYKILVNTTALKLRADGMAVTLIELIIYGNKDVAKARMERDVAETIYQTNLEHINVTKLKLRLLEAQVEREWGKQ